MRAFSLIELLCWLAITTFGCCIAIPGIQSVLFAYHANFNMQQIQTAINYARSLAIRHDCKVILCPSHDQIHCDSTNWADGIVVTSPKTRSRYFRLIVPNSSGITLRQSGFTNQKMTIEANGLTNYNGHFNYTAQKHNANPQFKLYFNKVLRIYVLKDCV